LIFNVDQKSMVGVNLGGTKPSEEALGRQTLVHRVHVSRW
jgi:hypothetical protein